MRTMFNISVPVAFLERLNETCEALEVSTMSTEVKKIRK
jgi:hypothetical protein